MFLVEPFFLINHFAVIFDLLNLSLNSMNIAFFLNGGDQTIGITKSRTTRNTDGNIYKAQYLFENTNTFLGKQ